MKYSNAVCSDEEFRSRIKTLRYSGNITESIEVCEKAIECYPNTYFYKKILGDLFFFNNNLAQAEECYLEYLKSLKEREQSFVEFAKRYSRFKRDSDPKEFANFVNKIATAIRLDEVKPWITAKTIQLIKDDFPDQVLESVSISDKGKELIAIIKDNTDIHFGITLAKEIESSDPIELIYIINNYILTEEPPVKDPLRSYFISTYEKFGRHSHAVELSLKLLNVKYDSIIARTVMRIARTTNNFSITERLIADFPRVTKDNDFNTLYELVYYYEHLDDLDKVKKTLTLIRKANAQSAPIQRTVKNFYIRFGLTDEAQEIDKYLKELASEPQNKPHRPEEEESGYEVGQKIRRLTEELAHSEQIAAISHLTTGISHELGQPITNIRYTIQFYRKLFKDKIDKEILFSAFDSILEETQRMGGLINRLAPITSSKSKDIFFSAKERIESRIKSHKALLNSNRINTRIKGPRDLQIYFDEVRFDQVINNLLLNSVHALNDSQKKEKSISILIKDQKDYILISIQDNGSGVPAKFRGKIFDPFFTTKDPGKGEGLGLFLVWNILKIYNAKIKLDDKYKNGTRFNIYIPKKINIADTQ